MTDHQKFRTKQNLKVYLTPQWAIGGFAKLQTQQNVKELHNCKAVLGTHVQYAKFDEQAKECLSVDLQLAVVVKWWNCGCVSFGD